MEPLFDWDKYRYEARIGKPDFNDDSAARTEAQKEALEHARSQASLLAQESGLSLGPIIQIEELGQFGLPVRGFLTANLPVAKHPEDDSDPSAMPDTTRIVGK